MRKQLHTTCTCGTWSTHLQDTFHLYTRHFHAFPTLQKACHSRNPKILEIPSFGPFPNSLLGSHIQSLPSKQHEKPFWYKKKTETKIIKSSFKRKKNGDQKPELPNFHKLPQPTRPRPHISWAPASSAVRGARRCPARSPTGRRWGLWEWTWGSFWPRNDRAFWRLYYKYTRYLHFLTRLPQLKAHSFFGNWPLTQPA